MKAVIVSVVGLLLALSVQAQNTCSKVPTYDENIVPTCTQEFYSKGIRLPNYENVQTYYTCPTSTTKTGVLNTCPSATPYFSLTYQSCNTCDDYLPAVKCSGLNLGLTCTPIGSSSSPSSTTTTTTTANPSDSTTTTTTKSTTTTTTTTTAMPGPPVDSSTTPSPGGETGGTTIYVPQPPSPNEGPTPPGPDPTVPNLPSGPPEVQ